MILFIKNINGNPSDVIQDSIPKTFPKQAIKQEFRLISLVLLVLIICNICGMLHQTKQNVIAKANSSLII